MHVRDVFLSPNTIGEGDGGAGCLNISFTNPLPNGMIVDSGLSEIETKHALCGGTALKPPHSSTLSLSPTRCRKLRSRCHLYSR